jgi:aldose 1-epimerase
MNITSKEFGVTKHGATVHEYTITNDQGASVSVLSLGGIISKVMVPDTNGTIANVVAGFDTVAGYESCPDFLGAAIGRSAGRIAEGQLIIDDVLYQLPQNQSTNNLHGGSDALDKKIWDVSEMVNADNASITLHYVSPDMEEGFPGELDCNITYTFDNNNA